MEHVTNRAKFFILRKIADYKERHLAMERFPPKMLSRGFPNFCGVRSEGSRQDKAEIGPRTEAALPRALAAVEEIRELRQTVKPLGVPIRQAIEEGRA